MSTNTVPSAAPVRSPSDYLVFGAPQIEEAEIAEVVASMRSGWLGTGPKVARFEEAFRAYRSAPHAVAVNSCTAALHLSMLAAGTRPGRRGDHHPPDLLRDGQRHHPRRRHARSRRRGPGHDESSTRRGWRRGDHRAHPRGAAGALRRAGPATWTRFTAHRGGARPEADRGLRARHRDRVPRPEGRDVRRLRLLQLLRHQERRHGRGRHGPRARRSGRGAHQGAGAARHEQGRLEALQRRGLQALRGRGVRLQVQHDGPPGRDRDPPAGARRGELAATARDLAALRRGLCATFRSASRLPPIPNVGMRTTSTPSWWTRRPPASAATTSWRPSTATTSAWACTT